MIYLLADMVSRIKAAQQKKSIYTVILTSSFCIINLKTMYDLGFLTGYAVINYKYSKVYLKYYYRKSAIRIINILSKKKFYVYLKSRIMRSIIAKNYFLSKGFLIMSVSNNFSSLTDIECVLLNCGGKALIFIS